MNIISILGDEGLKTEEANKLLLKKKEVTARDLQVVKRLQGRIQITAWQGLPQTVVLSHSHRKEIQEREFLEMKILIINKIQEELLQHLSCYKGGILLHRLTVDKMSLPEATREDLR